MGNRQKNRTVQIRPDNTAEITTLQKM